MPETESVTAATEIRDRLEFAVRADVRWKAARDVVNDARRLDRVHGSCVQAITDGFENQVGHGEYAAVFLLEVVRRLNPAVADAAARDLAQVWEDGQVGHERLGEWHAAVSAGQPMRLYIDVPVAGEEIRTEDRIDALPYHAVVLALRSGVPWLNVGGNQTDYSMWEYGGMRLNGRDVLHNYGAVQVLHLPQSNGGAR